MVRYLAAAAAAGYVALTAAGGQRATPILNAVVGENDAYTIGLFFPDGTKVATLKPGTYTVVVHDESAIHNFHLASNFDSTVNFKTEVPFVGDQSFTVTFRPNTLYAYACEPHWQVMNGSFRTLSVVTAPTPPTVHADGGVRGHGDVDAQSQSGQVPLRDWHPHRTLDEPVPDLPPGIRFQLEPEAGERVRFVSSPAYEAALSLHVLADPLLHAVQHGWVRRARRLPVALRRRIEAFRFAWVLGPPDFTLPRADAPDFETELARLRAIPAEMLGRRLVVDEAHHEFGIDLPHQHRHEAASAPARARRRDTRLRALRLIAKQPRSTQELAALVAISEAGLPKHLKALADAGLVTTRREGYYVLYSLDRDALARLPAELGDFLVS